MLKQDPNGRFTWHASRSINNSDTDNGNNIKNLKNYFSKIRRWFF